MRTISLAQSSKLAINATVYALVGADNTKALPSHTSVGCYPLVYVTLKRPCLCAACANAHTDEMDPVVEGGIHWEGEHVECAECSAYIESAYGPVAA